MSTHKTLRPDNCIGEVVFNTWHCYVLLDTYKADDSYCIRLVDSYDSLPVCTATVLLPYSYDTRRKHMSDRDVVIKDYSENAGILDCLVEAEIVSPILELKGDFPICRIIAPLPSISSKLSLEPKTVSTSEPRKKSRRSINPHSVWKG